MKRIYFDFAASTPVAPEVKKAMEPYFSEVFANGASLHQPGQEASAAIFRARQTLAKAIGANYQEIVFTGSATEANNFALRGVVKAVGVRKPQMVAATFEHESVLNTLEDLERKGVAVVLVPVSKDGFVNLKKLEAALSDRTILVSIMHSNNEVGTIQPIAEISRLIKAKNPRILLHTDVVQSFQYFDCHVGKLGVDLMTLSAHKIYGPKGIGALYIRKGTKIAPIITGSGQEGGLRSGTPNTPYIVGFGKAVEMAVRLRAKETARMAGLQKYFLAKLKTLGKKIMINGSLESRLPNNLNIYFPGQLAVDLLTKLDLKGVATSPGAACSARLPRSSYVLEAMGFPHERCSGSLRLSLGRPTTKADIDNFIKIVKNLL